MEHSHAASSIEMTGRPYGYARVSTADQDLTLQREALLAAGVPDALIHAETASGTTTDGRDELARLMVHLRPGDVLHVTRIDRLARSMHDFARIAHDLKSRGIGLKVIQQGIDTTQGGPVGALTTLSAPAGSAARTRLRPTRPPRDNGLGASVGCKWTSASISA